MQLGPNDLSTLASTNFIQAAYFATTWRTNGTVGAAQNMASLHVIAGAKSAIITAIDVTFNVAAALAGGTYTVRVGRGTGAGADGTQITPVPARTLPAGATASATVVLSAEGPSDGAGATAITLASPTVFFGGCIADELWAGGTLTMFQPEAKHLIHAPIVVLPGEFVLVVAPQGIDTNTSFVVSMQWLEYKL